MACTEYISFSQHSRVSIKSLAIKCAVAWVYKRNSGKFPERKYRREATCLACSCGGRNPYLNPGLGPRSTVTGTSDHRVRKSPLSTAGWLENKKTKLRKIAELSKKLYNVKHLFALYGVLES